MANFYTILNSHAILVMHVWKRRKNLNFIEAIRCCHVMYKLLYIRVRTAPPVLVRVSVSFSCGVTLLRILFLSVGLRFAQFCTILLQHHNKQRASALQILMLYWTEH